MWIIERLCVRQGSPDPILPTPPTNRLPASICPLRTFLFWPISNTQNQTWTQTLKFQKHIITQQNSLPPNDLPKFPLLPNCSNSEPNIITNSNLMMIKTVKIILIIIYKSLKTMKIFMIIMMTLMVIMLTLMIPIRKIKTGGSWRWWWTACSCGSSELLLWSVRMMIVVIKLTAMMMRMTSMGG